MVVEILELLDDTITYSIFYVYRNPISRNSSSDKTKITLIYIISETTFYFGDFWYNNNTIIALGFILVDRTTVLRTA